jgi:DNA-binding transcriptional LysR family regulator
LGSRPRQSYSAHETAIHRSQLACCPGRVNGRTQRPTSRKAIGIKSVGHQPCPRSSEEAIGRPALGADRIGNGANAEGLAGPLRAALQDIEGTLTPDTFDPAAAEGGFTIAVETYGTIVVLPQLVEIRKEAPGIEITVCSGSAHEILAGIDRGSFDLAIGSFRHLPDRFMTCHLLSDDHVCVMRVGHPEAQGSLSLEKYLAADHLLLSMSNSRSDEVDDALAAHDLARRIVMRVPHALAAVIALLRSDMLATLTRGAAQIFAEAAPLARVELPFSVPAARISACLE